MLEAFEIIGREGFNFGKAGLFDKVLLKPFAVGMLFSDLLLQFSIVDDATFFHIDEEHAAGFEAPLLDDVFGRDTFQDSYLGGENDAVVVGDVIAGGTEAIAVEGCTDLNTV